MIRTEQEQTRLRLHQAAERCARTGLPTAARFVAGEERSLAVHEAREAGVAVSFDGGWSGAEREQACFHLMDDEPRSTAVWVEAGWNSRFGTLEHRDLLGSLMGLGLDRSMFGDLVVNGDRAWVYCLPEVAARLPMEWQQAGRVTIRCKVCEEPPRLEAPAGELLHDTVASLRLDSVLQSGMRTSRARAAELIRQGLVMLDHMPEDRIDRQLSEGSLISVRGFGRIRLKHVGEPTKKERLPVELEIFSSR